jgi:DNA-binding CsgD family transcriptional regulator
MLGLLTGHDVQHQPASLPVVNPEARDRPPMPRARRRERARRITDVPWNRRKSIRVSRRGLTTVELGPSSAQNAARHGPTARLEPQYPFAVVQTAPLIYRENELAVIAESIDSAIAGRGTGLLIEGQAGIGKTSLLAAARQLAGTRRMAVVTAAGAVLERDLGFGFVRQLFEPVVARAPEPERHRLMGGAARLAAPIVMLRDLDPRESPTVDQPAVLHGLYWVLANIADRVPLLVVVDDIQWADTPSLRFLNYVAHRLEGMPVLLLGAVRTGEPDADVPMIGGLLTTPGVRVLRPAPLSVDGVGSLVRDILGEPADPAFVVACHTATGGVPFLAHELLGALAADGVRPTAEAAARVATTGSRTVAHAIGLRLSRLSSSAVAVVQAIAVLGRHARTDRISSLAGVAEAQVVEAEDALVRMGVLAAGQPIGFTHPLVHRAVYDDIPWAQRASEHARAARLLAAESAPADEVAAHLLRTEPAGQPEFVARLRDAAAQAVRRGAPQSAVAYLRRALDEGVRPGERCAVLHELARAEALVGNQAAVGRYEEAIGLAADPGLRALLKHELSQLYFLAGHWERGLALLQRAVAELGDSEPELAARIEAFRTGTEFYHPRYAGEFDERLPRLEALINRPDAAARALAMVVAGLMAGRGFDMTRVLELVTRGVDGGGFLRDEGPESLALPHAVGALVACDELDTAARVVADVLPEARRRGSVVGFGAGSVYRLWIDASRGQVNQAAGHLRAVIDLSLEHDLQFALPTAFLAGVDVLLERPDFDDAAALAESIQLEPALAASVSGAWVIGARGRLRGLRGEREAAIADLRSAGETFTQLRLRNPIMAPWRSPLALLLPRNLGGGAPALVASEMADARDLGLARCEGTALPAAGLLEGGQRGIAVLNDSLRVLDHPNMRLERARTLVELGAALRRADQRVRARGPLREGLDLAQQCGAEQLAARAVEELRVTGARPRRRTITGPDARTPSEARIVRMAVSGMGNRDIAQALCLTVRTVENHLGSAYRKLGIGSREELRRAVGDRLPAAKT